MPKYTCVRGVIVPDPEDPLNPKVGTRYLVGQTFEASPPTRMVETRRYGKQDWLNWCVQMGVLTVVSDDEVVTPGRPPGEAYPAADRLQDDGSFAPPEPETTEMED